MTTRPTLPGWAKKGKLKAGKASERSEPLGLPEEATTLQELHLLAPAKINLTLDVFPRREDGYHPIRSIMAGVSLTDRLSLRRGEEGTEPGLPEDNLAVKALRALEDLVGRRLPTRLELEKRIPLAAGLGGGSSDAAAVLLGLDRLFGLGLGPKKLLPAATRVGSDVPFFLHGGLALAEGRGEIIRSLPLLPEFSVVLAFAPFGVPTAEAYRLFDEHPENRNDTKNLLAALAGPESRAWTGHLGNSLAKAVAGRWPWIGEVRRAFLDAGALGSSLSGSGPTVYALADGPGGAEHLAAAVAHLAREVRVVRLKRIWPLVHEYSPDEGAEARG